MLASLFKPVQSVIDSYSESKSVTSRAFNGFSKKNIKAAIGVKVTSQSVNARGSFSRPSLLLSLDSPTEQLRTSVAVCPADCLYRGILFEPHMWPSLLHDFARIH